MGGGGGAAPPPGARGRGGPTRGTWGTWGPDGPALFYNVDGVQVPKQGPGGPADLVTFLLLHCRFRNRHWPSNVLCLCLAIWGQVHHNGVVKILFTPKPIKRPATAPKRSVFFAPTLLCFFCFLTPVGRL